MQPRIDALLTLKDHIAGYATLLKGDFEKDIAELKALKKDVDAKAALVDTAKKLEEQKKQADEYFSAKFDEAEKILEDAKTKQTELTEQIALAKEKQKEYTEKMTSLKQKEVAFEAEVKIRLDGLGKAETNFAERAEVLAKRKESLDVLATQLQEQKADLDKKVATIKQLAG